MKCYQPWNRNRNDRNDHGILFYFVLLMGCDDELRCRDTVLLITVIKNIINNVIHILIICYNTLMTVYLEN